MTINVDGAQPISRNQQVNINTPSSTTVGEQPTMTSRASGESSTMLKRQSLHMAAQKGDLSALLKAVVAARDAIDEVNPQTGLTPLQAATQGGHQKAAELLINAGARAHPVDPACPPEKISLYAASEEGRPELLAAVLASSGADLNTPDPLSGLTPLMFAIRGNHIEAAKMLIKAGALVSQCSAKGIPPIGLAAVEGDAAALALLVENGAAVDQKDSAGRTALLRATSHGAMDVARLLLQHGADVGTTDDSGRTALFEAVAMRQPDMIRLLLEHQSKIEHTDKYGHTALCLATQLGYAEEAALLVTMGANCGHQSGMMGTPLMIAARDGHQVVLELLLPGSMQVVNMQDDDGNTALHLAAVHGHDAAASALVKAGANLAQEDGRQNTPLEVAARAGHVEATRVLLDSDQDLERSARNGQNALKHAVHKKHVAVVELLLQRGIAVDDEDIEQAREPMISELLRRAPLLMQSMRPDDAEEDAAPTIDGARLVADLVDTAATRKHAKPWERRLKNQNICDGLARQIGAGASDLRGVWTGLAGSSRKMTPAQQKNWCAGILADLDNAILRDPPYTGKGLTRTTEATFNKLAEEQAHALAQAGLDAEQALRDGIDDLLGTCSKAVSDERFDPLDLYKLLTAQHGVYDTVASLIVSAFADVWPRRNQLGDLTLKQAFARELSERRQKQKMVQSLNSSSAEVDNQQTVQMLTFRQLDLLAAWCGKALNV